MTISAISRTLGAALVLTLASWIPATAQHLAQDVSRADVARTISPDIVISQVYGGGGNAGSLYKNDFIELKNIGFKKFSKDDLEANSEKIARFNVELYVEKMTFKLNYFDSAK